MASNVKYHYELSNGTNNYSFTNRREAARFLHCSEIRIIKLLDGRLDNIKDFTIKKIENVKKKSKIKTKKSNKYDNDEPYYVMESGYNILYN